MDEAPTVLNREYCLDMNLGVGVGHNKYPLTGYPVPHGTGLFLCYFIYLYIVPKGTINGLINPLI